jgi:hypothetical protein
MKCTLAWNPPGNADWEKYFKELPRSTLPQSPAYAEALATLGQGAPRRAVVMIDGIPAGLVQVIEKGFAGNIVHAVALDRGPLWFEGFGSPVHNTAFFTAFNKTFRARFGRRRRVIPETTNDNEWSGLRHRKEVPGYQTIWIDLSADTQSLRDHLKKNWRGSLNKAERAGLDCAWEDRGRDAFWLLKHYQIDKAQREYPGPSVELMKALIRTFGAQGAALTGTALLAGKPIAAILILCHGASATYQIGWTSEEGRTQAAHHLLLWDALRVLKERGIKGFDLGGVNDAAEGITAFKEGLGGEPVRLAGFYT